MPKEKHRLLFDLPAAPRAKPRKLMHVIDAGPGECDAAKYDMVRFWCQRCGLETDWQEVLRTEAKRGVPCPNCNK